MQNHKWDTISCPIDWQKTMPSIGEDIEQLIVMISTSATQFGIT